MKLSKLIAVIGPTGTGKTALAAHLARTFHGELVSCDSKQVYRRMDIGTNKEYLDIPQHLIDIKEPGEKITVAEYQALAYVEIDRLLKRGIQPIMVGASMMYAEAVMNGYRFGAPSTPKYEVLKLGIAMPREELAVKIAARTDAWIEAGLLDEIRGLLAEGVSPEWLKSHGQEYRYMTQHLEGELSLAEAIEKTNTSLRQYAKRQYTWWRRHADVLWVESTDEAEQKVRQFLGGV